MEGCAEEFWQNFATTAQNYKTKKLVETCLFNILERGEMGVKHMKQFCFCLWKLVFG